VKPDAQHLEMKVATSGVAKIAILLCTHNGEKFLSEQLESICNQTHSNWQIWASDDGSNDKTLDILLSFQTLHGKERLAIVSGPKKSFVRNFLSLTCHKDIQADYYAFSDQDDIWEPDKLGRALCWLESISNTSPSLYCSRTRLVDAAGSEIGFSPLFVKPPSFANALLQNIAGGNTMVFNNAARGLLMQGGKEVSVVAHDWWTYLVITGCGGHIHFDHYASVRYRQHGGNLIGSNAQWSSRLVRVRGLVNGQVRAWTERNLKALRSLESHLKNENRLLLEDFIQAREANIIARFMLFKRTGVYKQTLLGNLGLIFAILCKKI
jgi:glycosyltransferase involved in cell wall biosynthesis